MFDVKRERFSSVSTAAAAAAVTNAPVCAGLAVALQLLHGDIEQLRREYMVLFTRGVSITRKLGFSDIIMPGRPSSGGMGGLGRAAVEPGQTRNIQGSIEDHRGATPAPPHEGLVATATQA